MYTVNFSLEKFQPSHLIFPLAFRTFLQNTKQLYAYDLEIERFFFWVIVTNPSILSLKSQCKVLGRMINWWIDDTLALLLVFCVCGFHPVCPLMDKEKRLKEASWWEEIDYGGNWVLFWWAQFSSVTQSCLTLCDPMDCSKTGFPVHHQYLELAQTHVPWVGDAIQPSHPLSSPSPPAFNLSQHQGLFQWVSSSYQVAKVVEFQLQH